MKYVLCFFILIIILAAYAYSEVKRFKITTYTVKQPDLPQELVGHKILLLSDLHCTEFGSNNLRLINTLSDIQTDIIVIAGDLINGHSEKEFSYAEHFLKSLKQNGAPIYYTFGNHEEKLQNYLGEEGYNKYLKLVSEYCTVLNNASITVFESDNLSGDIRINLAGIDIPLSYYHAPKKIIQSSFKVNDYIRTVNAADYNILIAHDPMMYRYCFEWGANLVLSGHLHGGMFRLPVLGGIISPRYSLFPKPDKGLYNYKGQKLIVSGGLGWHSIPFRFLNLPEIIEINFESGKNYVKEKTLH